MTKHSILVVGSSNTDMIINRYREVTISLDYYGDSVINSVFDVALMVLGFYAAMRRGSEKVLGVVQALELAVYLGLSRRLNLNLLPVSAHTSPTAISTLQFLRKSRSTWTFSALHRPPSISPMSQRPTDSSARFTLKNSIESVTRRALRNPAVSMRT